MRGLITILTVAGLAIGASACTDSKRASQAATWGDQPADITCWTYGTENFSGRSTGKVEYDEGGRVSFVDAANGRYTTVEGDCRVVYRSGDAVETPNEPAPPVPAPPVPQQTVPPA